MPITTFDEHYQWKLKQEKPPIGVGTAVIQWKGSVVCLCFMCECGKDAHICGEEFCYYVKCVHCDRVYAMPETLKLVELDSANKQYVENSRASLVKQEAAWGSEHDE